MLKIRHILLPPELDFRSSIEFVQQLNLISPTPEFIFDFSDVRWVRPFGLLYVSNAIRQFIAKFPHATFVAEGIDPAIDAHGYASHMGFFRHSTVDWGKMPGDAKGSKNYLPITNLSTKELIEDGRFGSGSYGDTIEHHAAELARRLLQHSNSELFDTLKYSFTEIIRNVIEHSESPQITYCAQYWPRKNTAEIALADNGIGLKESLTANPFLNVSDDRDAIKLALMPGISGKAYRGVKIDPHNPWQNTGYGLYMMSRICGTGGEFFIASGTGGYLSPHDENIPVKYLGVIMRLVINFSNLGSLPALLSQFRNEGDLIARLHLDKEALDARTASRFLSTNFSSLSSNASVGNRVRHRQFG